MTTYKRGCEICGSHARTVNEVGVCAKCWERLKRADVQLRKVFEAVRKHLNILGTPLKVRPMYRAYVPKASMSYGPEIRFDGLSIYLVYEENDRIGLGGRVIGIEPNLILFQVISDSDPDLPPTTDIDEVFHTMYPAEAARKSVVKAVEIVLEEEERVEGEHAEAEEWRKQKQLDELDDTLSPKQRQLFEIEA